MANQTKPQGRTDRRVFLFEEGSDLVHLSQQAEIILPIDTLCGQSVPGLWRCSITQPDRTMLCVECYCIASDKRAKPQ